MVRFANVVSMGNQMVKKREKKRKRESVITSEAVVSPESAAPVEPRVPELIEQPIIVKTENVLYLCLAENSICNKTLESGRRFGPGQIVDLNNEMLSDGSKLRDHVRLACWRPIRAGGE